MVILSITCREDEIVLRTDITTDYTPVLVRAYTPASCEQLLLGEFATEIMDGMVSIPRYINGRDGLTLLWEAEAGGETAEGKKYVEDLDFPSPCDAPYPTASSKKGLQVSMIEDAVKLGVKHAAQNVCIGDFMRPAAECAHPIFFTHDGAEYAFDGDQAGAFDKRLKTLSDNGILVTLILLNSKHWQTDTSKALYSPLLHPGFLPFMNEPDVHLSAFNMTTDEGIRYYCAFVAFLAERYMKPDEEGNWPHGRAVGMIVSNEINSQWIWGNAGHKTVEEYMAEYTLAMRLTWQTAATVWKNARVYVSLDHFWTGAQDPAENTKYYGSRPVLEVLSYNACKEGEFPWNVAAHPYPEDLRYPDFWNDKSATDDNDTCRVTFKNLRVLTGFLYREENLYRGNRRRIILSEQGFNSHFTPESEILQACAYGRAYRICMEIPEIDSFILHAHTDNWHEFGLNLGLWRRKKDGPELDAPKPIYDVFRMIDQKDESGKYHWERY